MLVGPMKKISLHLTLAIATAAFPSRLAAQLVRDSPTPPPQASAKQEAQNSSALSVPPGKKRVSQEIQLTGEENWLDSGIDIQAGEHVLITATGKLRYADANEDNGPEGLGRGFKDLLRVLPFNEAGRGALIGRIGDQDTAQTFLIGARRDVLAPVSGRLSVGINQTTSDTGDGNYAVRIEIYTPEGGSTRVATRQVASLPGIDNQLFSKIPRRISDKDGNPGDMVNFLILGSETAMQRVFATAAWVKVDADVKDTVLHGVLGSLSKESYLTMPMSQLYLFGRPQDYGWAHASPSASSGRATICAFGKLHSRSRAKRSGLAPPRTTSDSNATNAITASPTRSIRTSISSATTSKKRSRLPAL